MDLFRNSSLIVILLNYNYIIISLNIQKESNLIGLYVLFLCKIIV